MSSPKQYANALLPDRFRVIGIELRDFCIGHALLLHKVSSPFLPQYSRAIGDGDLVLAVWICSRPWREAYEYLTARSTRFRLWVWGIQLRFTREDIHILEAKAVFRSYLANAWDGPSAWKRDSNEIGDGVPVIASLKVAICTQFGIGHEEALSYPIKSAVFDTACGAAMSGGDGLLSEEEEAFFRKGER